MTKRVGIGPKVFQELSGEYREAWGLEIFVVTPDGKCVRGRCMPACGQQPHCLELRQRAVAESLRWGEATIHSCPGNQLIWAVPIMYNSEVLGGIVAYTEETRVFQPSFDIRLACAALRVMLEAHNLTNAAMLEKNRETSHREKTRAQAIQAFKRQSAFSLQDTFLREEPALVAAMRRDDWDEARQRINNILVAMLHLSEGNLELTKSYFMELVITMCRTGVELGGDAKELLGTNYANIVALSNIDDEEELTIWLHQTLEHIFASVHRHVRRTAPVLLTKALAYMSEHFTEDISRDKVASIASMSPSHFSRMFRKHVGRSFVDFLNQMRVDRAAEFLTRTDTPLSLIAMDVGFVDQSYFTKVFRRYMNESPGQYRRTRRG